MEISFGPDRSKVTRYGLSMGPSLMLGTKDKYERVLMPPEKRAAINLYKSLKKYDKEFSEQMRRNIQITYETMPQIRYINTKVLAMVLAFMANNKNITKKTFSDKNVLPYISGIVSFTGVGNREKRKILDKYKATMLRYIRAVISFNKRRQLK